MDFLKSRVAGFLLLSLGAVFLLFPLTVDSYSHYLQDQTYKNSQEHTLSCRANLALSILEHNYQSYSGPKLERYLDGSCGILPKYGDFSYESESKLLNFYNWLAQKITFIPL
jgi:hypothetical protein